MHEKTLDEVPRQFVKIRNSVESQAKDVQTDPDLSLSIDDQISDQEIANDEENNSKDRIECVSTSASLL